MTSAEDICRRWFAKFEKDEEQNVALDLEHIRNSELSLICGEGSIVFKYDSTEATLVDICAVGDKFVRTLMTKTKARLAVEKGEQPTSLEHALEIFSDVAKLLGCGEMTDDDDNESEADTGRGRDADDDYTYEDCSQGIGNVSSEWMSTYYQVPSQSPVLPCLALSCPVLRCPALSCPSLLYCH